MQPLLCFFNYGSWIVDKAEPIGAGIRDNLRVLYNVIYDKIWMFPEKRKKIFLNATLLGRLGYYTIR